MVSSALQLRGVLDSPDRGDAGQCHRSGLSVRQAIRLARDDRGLDRKFFRVGAFLPGVEDTKHRVSDGKIRDTLAKRGDHAGKIAAQDVGEFEIAVAAKADFVVGCVDAGGVHVDHDLARAGGRVGCLAEAQHLWPAMAGQQHRFHD